MDISVQGGEPAAGPSTSTPMKKTTAQKAMKQHLCSVCGTSFTTSFNMVRHKKLVHYIDDESMKIKILKCDICGKILENKKRMVSHINAQHVQQKPYKCGICKKGFSSDLKAKPCNHNCTEGVKIPCTLCEKYFPTKHELKQHSASKSFECSNC